MVTGENSGASAATSVSSTSGAGCGVVGSERTASSPSAVALLESNDGSEGRVGGASSVSVGGSVRVVASARDGADETFATRAVDACVAGSAALLVAAGLRTIVA